MGEKLQFFVIVTAAVLLRWCVTYHPYSGQGKAPMYGDYEAQRHWQEITINLPIHHWYSNSSDNDLLYWGLDYPPLTAYHSLLIAKIAQFLDPEYVELYKSRGFESDGHKYFMRLTVILVDTLLYVSSIVCFVSGITIQELDRRIEGSNIFGFKKRDFILATALIYPGIILIDHAHFQYNCVSLGLLVLATAALLHHSTIAASFLFALALNYKQMELYHALPFFFYILGNNTPDKRKNLLACIRTLICVALTVVSTFVVIWVPFVQHWDCFYDAFSRLFPFGRGVFEDKVANFWCAINVVYKLRNRFTNFELARICLAATTFAILPSSLDLYLHPVKEKFVISLINSALGFYLFSFQVHEKSILLVAIPVVLYLHKDPLPCFWFLFISTFSMLPLFIKDELFVAYFSLTAFYLFSFCLMWSREFESLSFIKNKMKTHKDYSNVQRKTKGIQSNKLRSTVVKGSSNLGVDKFCYLFGKDSAALKNSDARKVFKIWLFCASICGAAILTVASVVVEPPKRYPDLFALLVSIYSCLHFSIFFIYFNYKQISISHTVKAKPY